MKALDWQKFFAEQRGTHGKVVFSVAELANAAQTTLHVLNTELGRLVRRGLIARYAHGQYGPVQGVGPEDLVPQIDPGALTSPGFTHCSATILLPRHQPRSLALRLGVITGGRIG